ncbi:hypothetical protein BZG36_01412 [Bifiguratus adelaidae]|uniref:Probable lysosomal cobalamin transporter n=1 Tax=Bifiguratus adelaidae TaxID=1938954 RepID=A0A261Y507_9FUNG|nr:hypothetical protein BZG36_01412 [Bifiguratus adelaidae]
MLGLISWAWIVYGIIVACFVFLSIAFVTYYQDRRESELLATAVTIAGLSLLFATLTLFPVDIFLVSSTVDKSTGLKKDWATPDTVYWITFIVRAVYYSCYAAIAVFSFLIIPFTYFFYEEYEEDRTTRERVAGAFKYTSFFVVISIIIVLVGLFIHPANDGKIDLDWFRNLISENIGERALSLITAILMLVGTIVFIFYTAPGMSLLPIGMIKGRRDIQTEDQEVSARLAINRENQRAITAKYANNNASMSTRDRKHLDALEMQESVLARRLRNIEETEHSWWSKLLKVVRPFEFLIGLIVLCLSILVVVSMTMTSIDKLRNSFCGAKCGYILPNTAIINPLDWILVRIERFFPVDLVLVLLIVLVFFFATVSGLLHIGVRFMWITLYKIRKAATQPQALLFGTVLMMLSLLALNYTLTMVVAPEYSHFGNQKFCNHTDNGARDCTKYPELIVPCDITAPPDICTPTVVSTLINRISLNIPLFGVIFYYAQWVFIAVFSIAFLIALFKAPQASATDEDIENLMEAEEEASLLDAAGNPRILKQRNNRSTSAV